MEYTSQGIKLHKAQSMYSQERREQNRQCLQRVRGETECSTILLWHGFRCSRQSLLVQIKKVEYDSRYISVSEEMEVLVLNGSVKCGKHKIVGEYPSAALAKLLAGRDKWRGGGNSIYVGLFKITSNSESFFFGGKKRNQYSNIKMQINGRNKGDLISRKIADKRD